MEKTYYILDDRTGRKEPTVRLLYETILNDFLQGVRFYNLETLEEYSDAKDVLFMFLAQKDLYVRVPSECETLNGLSIEEILEFCKNNEFSLSCDCNDPTKCRTPKEPTLEIRTLQ